MQASVEHMTLAGFYMGAQCVFLCICVYPLFPHSSRVRREGGGDRVRQRDFMRLCLSPSMSNTRACHDWVSSSQKWLHGIFSGTFITLRWKIPVTGNESKTWVMWHRPTQSTELFVFYSFNTTAICQQLHYFWLIYHHAILFIGLHFMTWMFGQNPAWALTLQTPYKNVK